MNHPQRLSSTTVFSHPRVRVAVERFAIPDGEIERAVLYQPRCAAVIVQPSPDTLLLVRQWRYPVERWTWEIPAGTCEPGEDPADCARRELAEEAGFAVERLVPVIRYVPEHGLSTEEIVLFHAAGALTPTAVKPDPGELIAPRIVLLTDLPELVAAGDISDAKTLLALAFLGVRWHGR